MFLINQHADLKTKMSAIREFNALKARIQQKIDITSKGEKITYDEKQIAQIAARANNGRKDSDGGTSSEKESN